MAPVLSVPHSQQLEDGYCLPACVQMVLAFLGQARPQEEIARSLGLRKGFGVPASNIAKLRIRSIVPFYETDGTLERLKYWQQMSVPAIAFVQAGELPHWYGIQAQHAVLIVGVDRHNVRLHDPTMAHGPIAVPIDDFLLAWQEMDNRYAVLVKRAV